MAQVFSALDRRFPLKEIPGATNAVRRCFQFTAVIRDPVFLSTINGVSSLSLDQIWWSGVGSLSVCIEPKHHSLKLAAPK